MDHARFIANALSPAKVTRVVLDDTVENRTAIVVVPDRQLSLAIGKEGQNARLSAKLTGWRIDIKSETEAEEEGLDAYARELANQRARIALARARAESEDILSVAEQLLGDGEGEAELEPVLAEAPELEAPAPLADDAVAETPAEAVLDADVAEDEYDDYADEDDEYDEYGDYDEYDEYDEYDDYDEYEDYEDEEADVVQAEVEAEVEAETEVKEAPAPASRQTPAPVVEPESLDDDTRRDQKKGRDKRRKLVYDEDLGEVIAVRRHKRGRKDWYDYEEE
jgi:hypothetical protein